MPNTLASPRVLLLALAAASSACATSPVYWPNVTNSPQIMQRGDVEATMYMSSEGFLEMQSSAAITRKFALVANGSYIAAGCGTCSRRIHKFGEAGIGYFSTNIDDKTVSYIMGFGVGTTDWVSKSFSSGLDLANLYRATGDYSRGFLQVNAVERRERYHVSTAVRISGVHFSDYARFELDTVIAQGQYTKPRAWKGTLTSFYVEPSIRVLWKVKSVKVGPAFGFAFPLNAPPAFGHRPANVNFGFDIGGR